MRHEQSAPFAADAFARCSRTFGACFLFAGPGYTNASNGITMAYNNRIPMVCVVNQHPTLCEEKGAGAASFAAEVLRPVSKWTNRLIDTRMAAHMTRRAVQEATSYPQGPVVLEIPDNLVTRQATSGDQWWNLSGALRRPPSSPAADPNAVEDAVKLLLAAERPVLVSGESVHWDNAAQELRRLAESLNIPVITRRSSRGAVSEGHPLAFYGRARGAILKQADVALLIGLSLGYLEDYGRWGGNTRFIQLHRGEADVDTSVRTELALIGDSKHVLGQMAECAASLAKTPPPREKWLEEVQSRKQAEALRLANDIEKYGSRKPLHPSYLSHEVVNFLDPEATFIFDAFTGSAYLTERVRSRFSGQVVDTGEWVTVGHGVGMGIGAQLARPGKQVFVMMGDGGIGIGGFDVETAVRYKQPVVYMIFNNSSWAGAAVEMFWGEDFLLADGSRGNPQRITPTRYDHLFAAMGCHTERVEEPAQVRPALERAFASGKTAVIDAVVDPKAYHPMILRQGPQHRWLGADGMSDYGRSLAFPERYPAEG
jgi:acetolactate synthase-1/2/3 large subunit